MTIQIVEYKSLITSQNHNQTQISTIIQISSTHNKPKPRKIINTRDMEKNKIPLLSMWAQTISNHSQEQSGRSRLRSLGGPMTRLYPWNAAALDRGLERALGLPTIPELGLSIPRKMWELALGCPTWWVQ